MIKNFKLHIQGTDFISFIKEYLIVAFLLATIWSRILSHSDLSLLIANSLLAIAGIVGIISMLFQGRKQLFIYIVFLLICWLFELLINEGKQYYDFTDLINTVFFFGIAYLFFTGSRNYKIYGLLYYFVSLYFFITVAVLKTSYRGLLADGNSYNYISCYVILYFSIYAFALLSNGKKIGYIDSVLLVVVCLYCYGRTGIISSLLYALGFAFIKIYEKRMKWFTYFLIGGAIILLFVFSNRLVTAVLGSANFGKFAIYGLDLNGRQEIWGAFMRDTMKNIITFFAGANPLERSAEGNLHNSFLLMWASFGFLFFIVNLIVIIKYTASKIKSKEYYLLLVVWTFFFRAFFDKMMFRWYGEIIMFTLVFATIMVERNKP